MKLCLVCNFQFGDEQELCPKDLSKLVPIGKDPLIGKLIQERYRIESLIAKGSMGVIYRATQELIGREVAVKVMHGYLLSDEESIKRYHKEAKAASRLNHANITTIFDFGVLSTGQPYIVMDLLQGKTLAEVLKERGQLTISQCLMVFQQVCDALAEAHKCGVFHRDIKPENIVIEELPDGKHIQVKVVDFGIATFAEGSDDTLGKITKTGTVCGSPFYMSPEQCDASKIDHRSDLYSLGVVLFEAITGKVPFESKDIYQVLTMQVKDPPPRLRKLRPELEIPEALELMVAKALAKDPQARYQSAQEFWNALAAAAGYKKESKPSREITKSIDQIPELVRQKRISEAHLVDQAAIQKVYADQMQNAPPQDKPAKGPPPELLANSEELKAKIRAATLSLTEKEDKGKAKRRKRKEPVTSLDRFIALCQIALPPALTLLVTVLLFWVIVNESLINSMIGRKYGQAVTVPGDIDVLLAKDKLDQAREILEKAKKERTLSGEERQQLNWVYIRLAKKEAKAKRFKQAANLLELTSPDMKEEEEVKILLKRYRKQIK